MILLFNGQHSKVTRILEGRPEARGRVGRLVTPLIRQPIAPTALAGIPWAVDNGAFVGMPGERLLEVVDEARGLPGCLFVVVPDQLADARETRRLWDRWAPQMVDFPRAYVLQDGQDPGAVPWDQAAAVFLGGTTAYKESVAAGALLHEAGERGLWRHVGRVNTDRRVRLFLQYGVESIDGTGLTTFWKAHLRRTLNVMGEVPLG